MEKLKTYLEEHKNARILDMATGQGSFIALLTQLYDGYSEIIGIDNNDKAIESAKRNFSDPRISFVKMDMTDMDLAKNSFDIVCLSNSLHHMSDISGAMENMMEMVRPDGILLFNEMISDNTEEKQMTHTHFHHFWAEVNRQNGIVHNETMTRRELLGIFNGHSGASLAESWEMSVPEQGDMPPEAYDFLRGTLDKSLKAVEGHEEYKRFSDRAEELKKMLDEVGFASATQILAVMKTVQ